MAWWKKVFGTSGDTGRVAYYDEGLALMAEGKFHEALTSFRLALKESPGDAVVLQQIAISYTRIGMTEEAAKTYRHVLQKNPYAPRRALRSGLPPREGRPGAGSHPPLAGFLGERACRPGRR